MDGIHGKRILFLNWKDITNPYSGGAEVLTDALARSLARTNDVTYITSRFPHAASTERIHNYTIIRRGTQVTCMIYAFFLFHRMHAKKPFDIIVDQAHGIPFFSILYANHPRIITLIHEVAGDLWASIVPRSIGNIIDTLWLGLYKNQKFITVSNSTKEELVGHRIPAGNIYIVPNFTDIAVAEIPPKAEQPTLVVLGRIAPVKRIEHAIAAYHIAKKKIPNLKLVIIGKKEKKYEAYYDSITHKIGNDPAITLIEHAPAEEKIYWLKQAHALLMSSKKEGYGIAILEANICGTPAIGYDVAGIRDAISNKKTGIVLQQQHPLALAEGMLSLLGKQPEYALMKQRAHQYGARHTREKTIQAFDHALNSLCS